jgi:hypothetical protein
MQFELRQAESSNLYIVAMVNCFGIADEPWPKTPDSVQKAFSSLYH